MIARAASISVHVEARRSRQRGLTATWESARSRSARVNVFSARPASVEVSMPSRSPRKPEGTPFQSPSTERAVASGTPWSVIPANTPSRRNGSCRSAWLPLGTSPTATRATR